MAGDLLKKRKIAVLGSPSVGKSSLVIQFVENNFAEAYHPTIESVSSKSVKYKGVEYECDILDTAGQDEFSILCSRHAIGVHGFVLVYSVGSRSSLDMCQVIHNKITDFCGKPEIPCVIVGSKVDLPASGASRQVPEADARRVAEKLKANYVETSAKNNINVGKVFELCLGEIERRSPNATGEPPSSKCIIM